MDLQQFFVEGGWGMYPTLALGATAVAVAANHALRPGARHVPLAVGLGLATLGSGALGFTTGLISTFKYVEPLAPERQGPIVLIGIGESLTNVVLAVMLATLVALLAGIGSWRSRATAA